MIIKCRDYYIAGINIGNLDCHWRHNKKATMTKKIFIKSGFASLVK